MASSCSDFHKKRQLQEIQQLRKEVETSTTQMQGLPLQDLEGIQAFFSNYLTRTARELEGKQIHKDDAYLLDSCKWMLYQVEVILKNKAFVEEQHLPLLEQLHNLEHDVVEQAGSRQSYDAYIGDERKRVKELVSLSTAAKQLSESLVPTANRLGAKIESHEPKAIP